MAHLFVIPGHGAGDPGAGAGGYNEAERVRALATKIKEYGGDNVTLADFSRNYYADNGISKLDIPKDWQILELHMDSASASAKGGHVIIKSGFSADKYDNALAKFISSYFPGRSVVIDKRSDLANANRSAAKGYSYRLLEVCFISNAEDRAKFNNNLDAIAKGILEAFDIKPGGKDVNVAKSTVLNYINGRDTQVWVPHWDEKMEWFTLENKASGLYLDLANGEGKSGTNVRVYTYNGATGQQWRFEQLKGFNYQPSYLTPIVIEPKANTKLAVSPVDGSYKAGVGTKVYTADKKAPQNFAVIDRGNKEWIIVNIPSLLALEVVS